MGLGKITRILPDKLYLQLLYYKHFKKFINFKNPKTFNEKLQWLKLYNRNPEYTKMVDKYLVREYIAEKIGEEYLIPLLGVWDEPEEIDFSALPNQFVLKWNHDSGSVIICRDKTEFDEQKAVEKLKAMKSHNGFWYGREWPYKNVSPKITAEKYLTDFNGGLRDYKFFIFNGEAKFLYISEGLENHQTAQISFYDFEGNEMKFHRSDFSPFSIPPIFPENLQEMKLLGEKLAKEINCPFVRVDFYSVAEKIYFSEITFFPCSGILPFEPKEWDLKLGKMINLEKLNKK